MNVDHFAENEKKESNRVKLQNQQAMRCEEIPLIILSLNFLKFQAALLPSVNRISFLIIQEL